MMIAINVHSILSIDHLSN